MKATRQTQRLRTQAKQLRTTRCEEMRLEYPRYQSFEGRNVPKCCFGMMFQTTLRVQTKEGYKESRSETIHVQEGSNFKRQDRRRRHHCKAASEISNSTVGSEPKLSDSEARHPVHAAGAVPAEPVRSAPCSVLGLRIGHSSRPKERSRLGESERNVTLNPRSKFGVSDRLNNRL